MTNIKNLAQIPLPVAQALLIFVPAEICPFPYILRLQKENALFKIAINRKHIRIAKAPKRQQYLLTSSPAPKTKQHSWMSHIFFSVPCFRSIQSLHHVL